MWHMVFPLQLRLDIENFQISGPTTSTLTIGKRVVKTGVITNDGTVPVNEFTRCLTDTFVVSNTDGPGPPAICGINSGEHS